LNLFKIIKKEILLGSLLLISASYASADNILNLGEGINLIASNGKEVNTDSFLNNSTTYKLPNGINQIMVNYTAEIKRSGEYELEHSKSFVLLFEQHDKNLKLSAPEIKKLIDIKEFEKKSNWALTTSSGKKVDFKAAIIEKNGFQFGRDYERELEIFNKSNNPASLPKKQFFTPTDIKPINSNMANKSSDINKENTPAKMLIFWYNQADQETRNSFKELIKNH
tara:strand:+ start:12558 stop:13229 length:672 start_codon:yes stop_codon:yes gene_type:complete